MKKWFLSVSVVFCLSGACWMVAEAATTPSGPYQKSCKKCSVNGRMDTLFCTCNKADQSTNDTSLSKVSECKQAINNCNGVLKCGGC